MHKLKLGKANQMKKILICVGTRPNLIKITQFDRLIKKYDSIEYRILHTGQHYDYNMNNVFFEQLGIKEPDVFLNINSSSQIDAIGQIMVGAEKVMIEYNPDLVIVPGDVNSTFACGFVARYLGLKLAHLESGLRSFDIKMPEENNRVLVDSISDYYFVTEQSGIDNLIKENVSDKKIFFVGNTMIDTLVASKEKIDSNGILNELGVVENDYFLLTFHRPANVDNKESLSKLVSLALELCKKRKVVFPIHPRTKKNLEEFGLNEKFSHPNLVLVGPLGYFEFLKLVSSSKAVITDSGGIQEETTYLGVSCLTVRPNTERPVTITEGTNTLLRLNVGEILEQVEKIEGGVYKKGKVPDLWDGNATERIMEIVAKEILA